MLETSSLHGSQAAVDMESDDICWICLDGTKDRDPLVNPCRCPRKVHPRCLARWQLQQAGRLEETNCRFCQCNLADWKASLTPENLKPDVQRVQPIMVVYFEGQIHRIPVKQGPDGLKEFTHRIRELFRLPDDVDISLTFGCKEPLSGQHLKLEGIGAFDAAVHCASVAAAERQQKLKSTGGSSDAGGVGSGGAAAAAVPTAAPLNPVPGSGSNNQQPPLATITSAPDSSHSTSPTLNPSGYADTSLQHLHSHYQHPYPHPHLLHNRNYHQFERSASTIGGGTMATSSSAPASAQTSGGGSDAFPAGALHPTASAPVLTHYPSDSSLVTSQHTTTTTTAPPAPSSPSPQEPHASSLFFSGCPRLSDEAGSSALSAPPISNGGSGGSRAAAVTARELLPVHRTAADTLAADAVSERRSSHASAAPSEQQLSLGPQHPAPSTSPFQAAAMEATASRIARRATGCRNEGLPIYQHTQHPQQHPTQSSSAREQLRSADQRQPAALTSQYTAPTGIEEMNALSSLASAVPLAAAISEPVPCSSSSGCSGLPVARSVSPADALTALTPQPTEQQPEERQIQNTMDLATPYASFPYAMAPAASSGSPYAAPLLPPLATGHTSSTAAAGFGHPSETITGSAAAEAPCQLQARAPSAPSAPSSVPLTPRDHYIVDERSHANAVPDSVACTSQAAPCALPLTTRSSSLYGGQREESRSRITSFGLPQLPQLPPLPPPPPPQQQQGYSSSSADQSPSALLRSAQLELHESASAAAQVSDLEDSARGASLDAGPATPVQPAARRATGSPTTCPRPSPTTLTTAMASPPLSPTASTRRYHATEQQPLPRGLCLPGASALCGAGDADCGSGEVACGSGAAASHRSGRRHRVSSSHHSRTAEYDIALQGASDDAAVLGSLTGRLKYSLITFSKKVVRSLNFQRGHGPGAVGGPGAYPHALHHQQHVGFPLSPVTAAEAVVAEATETEAEVGTAVVRQDCAAVVAATAAVGLAGASPAVASVGTPREH